MNTPKDAAVIVVVAEGYWRLLAENDIMRTALEKIAAMADVCPDDLSAKQARAALAALPNAKDQKPEGLPASTY